MCHELCKELDRLTEWPACLTEDSEDRAWDRWLAQQIVNIAGLAATHPHDIGVYKRSDPRNRRLNCFAFVLGLSLKQ